MMKTVIRFSREGIGCLIDIQSRMELENVNGKMGRKWVKCICMVVDKTQN